MREIEASLEAFVEKHSLASFVLGANLGIVARTESLSALTGSPARSDAARLADLLPAQAGATLEQRAGQILDSGGVWQGMIRSHDGRELGARLEAAQSATGRREFVLATLVDMDGLLLILRQIEELNVALQYRVAELAATLDFAPAGIIICEDPKGCIVRANRRAAEFFDVDVGRNLSRHRSVTEPVDVLVEPDGESLSLDSYLLDRARRKKPRGDETVALRCPNGDVLYVSMAVAPLVDQEGKLRGAIGSFTDVTELMRVTGEASVRARQQAAMARLALYAVSERDPDKIIKRVLEACTNTLGVKFCKVLELDRERNVLRLRSGKGWKRGRVGHSAVSADRGGSPDGLALHSRRSVVIDDFAAETRFTDRKFYEDHVIVGGVSVVIDGGDGPWGVLGAHTDRKRQWSRDDLNFVQSMAALLSTALQRRDFEERLSESEAQLTQAEKEERLRRTARLASLGTLAAGIAHEINNPLNSMLMNAELGQIVARNLNGGQGTRIEELFARIIEDCRRCANITSGVLQFSRSDDAPKESGDINSVLQRSKDLLASFLPLYDMSCDLDLLEPAPPVSLNQTELEQALVNLMRNAAEAGASKLRIRSRLDGDYLVISLRDDGPGIATESFGRLFDPFFSTRREQGGTGLGLSLVHRIVHDHGGTVSARNVADNGAQFDIRLPIDWSSEQGG